VSASGEERARAGARLHEIRRRRLALEQETVDAVGDAARAGLPMQEIANALDLGQTEVETLARAAGARGRTIEAGS